MVKTLQEINEIIGGELIGDGAVEIFGLSSINNAKAGDLTFADSTHVEKAKDSAASAVIVPANFEGALPKNVIKSAEPRAAFAKMMKIFAPKIDIPVGISDEAHIGANTKIADDATIMPFVFIGDNVEIGSGAVIYPNTYIGQNVSIGAGTIIYSGVTIREYCKIGSRCVIHSSTVIGADGFGFTTADGVHTKVPQIGNVVVEDDVEIGACVGIDRAAMGSTIIGHGTKIDNLVHIAHNCVIGANCLIVAQTGISGSTIVGDNVTFGGQTGTVGHIKIGGHSVYAARSGITKSMPEGVFCSGFPVQPHVDWLKMQVALKKVPSLIEKIWNLERKVRKLERGEE